MGAHTVASLVELVLTEKSTGNGVTKCVSPVQSIAQRYRTELLSLNECGQYVQSKREFYVNYFYRSNL